WSARFLPQSGLLAATSFELPPPTDSPETLHWLRVWDPRTWQIRRVLPGVVGIKGASADGTLLLVQTERDAGALFDRRSWCRIWHSSDGEAVGLSADGRLVVINRFSARKGVEWRSVQEPRVVAQYREVEFATALSADARLLSVNPSQGLGRVGG